MTDYNFRASNPESFRQIEANRRNALKSTGPKTAAGKDQSRRNAVKARLPVRMRCPILV
jgi:hypothetical protein